MTVDDRIGRLIAETGAGDRRAFSALISAQGPALYGLALWFRNDELAAQALYEKAWNAVWAAAPEYRKTRLAGTDWLILVLREVAFSDSRRMREAAQEVADTGYLADLPPLPPRAEPLGPCLARLMPDDAEALTRALLHGESEAELAQRFGLPVGRMRHALDHALATVDHCLGNEGGVAAARRLLGLASAEEARLFDEAVEGDHMLAAAQARWGRAIAAVFSAPPHDPPSDAGTRVLRQLFVGQDGGILRRIGLIPSLVAALIGALFLVWLGTLGAGLSDGDPAPEQPALSVDDGG